MYWEIYRLVAYSASGSSDKEFYNDDVNIPPPHLPLVESGGAIFGAHWCDQDQPSDLWCYREIWKPRGAHRAPAAIVTLVSRYVPSILPYLVYTWYHTSGMCHTWYVPSIFSIPGIYLVSYQWHEPYLVCAINFAIPGIYLVSYQWYVPSILPYLIYLVLY